MTAKKTMFLQIISFVLLVQDSRTIAKAFIKLGLKRFYSVGILGFNSPGKKTI